MGREPPSIPNQESTPASAPRALPGRGGNDSRAGDGLFKHAPTRQMMVVSFKAEAARRSHETPSKKDTDAAIGRKRRVTVWLENIQPKGHAGEEEEEDKG